MDELDSLKDKIKSLEYQLDTKNKKIAELEAEINEDEDIIESAYNQLEEAKTRILLAQRPKVTQIGKKKVEEYENRIAELEKCVEIFSLEEIGNKKNEMANYVQQIIAIKNELNSLKNIKRIHPNKLDTFGIKVNHIESNIIFRYIQLNQIVNTLTELEKLSKEELLDKLVEIVKLMPHIAEIATSYQKELDSLTEQIDSLKESIIKFNGGSTYQEMSSTIIKYEKDIQAYIEKTKRLEYELEKLQNSL